MTDPPRKPPLRSVALISAAALATEVLLSRLFAIVHWYHFAYMIISLALLGFGASGTFLSIARSGLTRHFESAYLVNAACFGLLAVASPLLARALPFQADALLWDPWQPLWLALVYLVLSAPFFFAANAIGLTLTVYHRRAGRVYAADLAGAGLGALSVIGLLSLVWPETALRLSAAIGLLAVLVGALELRVAPLRWAGAALVGIAVLAALPGSILRFEPGPYKSLSQALQIDGASAVLERSGQLGRLTVVASPLVPFRHAPGLSLFSTSEPPPQLGLFSDGEGFQAITSASKEPARLAFLEQSTNALAYHLRAPGTVFVPAAGGGMEILRALHFGAETIDAVELNPQAVRLLQDDFAEYTGLLVESPGVDLVSSDARGFLAGTDRRYDVLQLTVDGSGASGGLSGLSEDYDLTVEMMRLYLKHLEPGGFLSITGSTRVPPRDSLKLVSELIDALQPFDATDRLLMIRGWQTFTLLAKNGPAGAQDIARMRAFAESLSFDLVWYPGMRASDANQYNQLREPWYHEGVRALLGDRREDFVAGYPFDIRPATDDRPYFRNFFRWPLLAQGWEARGRGGMTLLELGYPLLVATLLQALLAAMLLIVFPLLFVGTRSHSTASQRWKVFAYFASIGLAFVFLEVVFLQKLMLLVHHPTMALALMLAVFLAGAGAGSAFVGTRPPDSDRRTLLAAVAGILLLGTAGALLLDSLSMSLSTVALAVRVIVASILILPLAICMGMPFPLAIRRLEEVSVPWAWAINGCASVVGAVLSTLLAIEFGFAAVLLLALLLYMVPVFVDS